MALYLVEHVVKTKIPLNAMEKDIKDIMDPLYNREKIYEWPIMNVEIGRDENVDINHQARHIVQLKNEWTKKPFRMDPIR